MFNNIINRFNKLKVTLVKNKCTKMYFLCIYLFIYFMLSILQIYLHIYVLNKNNLQLYFCCNKHSLLNWNNKCYT